MQTNLKKLAKAKGLKLGDVAKHLGVAKGTVSQWSGGKVLPKEPWMLDYLCHLLDCQMGELLQAEAEWEQPYARYQTQKTLSWTEKALDRPLSKRLKLAYDDYSDVSYLRELAVDEDETVRQALLKNPSTPQVAKDAMERLYPD